MSTRESLQNIAARLFRENICLTPLDTRSLEIIKEYLEYSRYYSDLCRRLSNIELNYVQILSEAQEACLSASTVKETIISLLESLTTGWRREGFLTDYSFSVSSSDYDAICASYVRTVEQINGKINGFSKDLLTISETAAQVRACSASFTEVYRESKLAVYAAMLSRNVESVLDARATSLQAHASARECEKLSSVLIGNSVVSTKIFNCINKMLVDVGEALSIGDHLHNIKVQASLQRVNTSINTAIESLRYLNVENIN